MHKLTFSHNYPKLWGQKTAKLIALEPLTVSGGLNPALKEYDTKTVDGEYYPLPDGEYLQLIFIGEFGIPFCTIRRMTYEKVEYYSKLRGLWLDIEIREDGR